jgi:hypothetical protein
MKLSSVYRPAKAIVGSIIVAIALTGCGHLERGNDPRQEKDLAEVVEALQYAIETAAANKVWKATEQESKHWNEACKDAKTKAADACFAMFTKAIPLCLQVCTGSTCNPVGQRQCERLIKGESVDQLCSGTLAVAQSDWCAAARGCNSASKLAAPMCENAESIVMPELVKADVTLLVERKKEISSSVNFLIVSFGGTRSEIAANELTMTLKPRVRDRAYGSAPITALPEIGTPSKSAQALAADLAKVITDAVDASVKEYEPGEPNIVKRGAVMVSELAVTFTLTVDSGGKLGIKRAWETPAGIDFGGGSAIKRTNSLTVTYARPK